MSKITTKMIQNFEARKQGKQIKASTGRAEMIAKLNKIEARIGGL